MKQWELGLLSVGWMDDLSSYDQDAVVRSAGHSQSRVTTCLQESAD